jgi:hypothetical protein
MGVKSKYGAEPAHGFYSLTYFNPLEHVNITRNYSYMHHLL